MVLMPGFQSTRLATEGALEPFLFLYTDDSIQGNPETCNQSSMMLNYEVKNIIPRELFPDVFIMTLIVELNKLSNSSLQESLLRKNEDISLEYLQMVFHI